MFESENKWEELAEQVEELVSRKRYAELRGLLLPLEAADIAWLCDELDERAPHSGVPPAFPRSWRRRYLWSWTVTNRRS